MAGKYDYIIVGQGIAGTVLSYMLLKRGMKVLVVDDPSLSSASKIAAGLYNPVVFKRLVKSWMADELIPFMDEFYTSCERELKKKFYHKKQIIKLFAEPAEKEFWLKKSGDEVGKYLSKTGNDHSLDAIVHAPFGFAEVIRAGNLDTASFLLSFREYFREQDALMEEKFEYGALELLPGSVAYKENTAGKIIFCEGYKVIENPFFKELSFKLTKGEILTIKLEDGKIIPENKVINKGVFILPLSNGIYKVGSTYEWNDLGEAPTEKGKEELLEKLSRVLKVKFEVIGHQAGIRPTVSDRRPILGLHPVHPGLGIFNGMGTKGIMLAPYFADHLIRHLEEGQVLDKEVDLERFNKS
ncbi:MAG TPA: FAD-dependent oxidoreductase [Bacteroidia bacterium]